MKIITLKPITRKGKNRVQEHGNIWRVLECREQVQCFNNRAGIKIQSLKDTTIRWIQKDNDKDFIISNEVS